MSELDRSIYTILYQLEQYALVADEVGSTFSDGVFGLTKHRKGNHSLTSCADLRQEFDASATVNYDFKELLEGKDESTSCCELHRLDAADKEDLLRISVFPSPALKASQKQFSNCLQKLIHLASIKQQLLYHCEEIAFQQGHLPRDQRHYTPEALLAADSNTDEGEGKVQGHEERKTETPSQGRNIPIRRILEVASIGSSTGTVRISSTIPMSADLDTSDDEDED